MGCCKQFLFPCVYFYGSKKTVQIRQTLWRNVTKTTKRTSAKTKKILEGKAGPKIMQLRFLHRKLPFIAGKNSEGDFGFWFVSLRITVTTTLRIYGWRRGMGSNTKVPLMIKLFATHSCNTCTRKCPFLLSLWFPNGRVGEKKKTKHQQLEKVAADTTMVNRGPDRELAQHSTVNNIPGEHIAKKQTGATCWLFKKLCYQSSHHHHLYPKWGDARPFHCRGIPFSGR